MTGKDGTMTRLHDLYRKEGQSPWLDNLRRDWLTGGRLAELVDQGVRGITSNPTIFAKAIAGEDDYDEQFRSLVPGHTVEEAYWELVIADIDDALEVLRPLHDESGGADGFVSLEVAPSLANDTEGTVGLGPEPARADRPAQPAGEGARRPRPGCRPSTSSSARAAASTSPSSSASTATTRSWRPTSRGWRPSWPPAPPTSRASTAWPRSS